MSRTAQELARARMRALTARTRLTGTLVELQTRLRPGALLEEAFEELREKTAEMADEAVSMVKERPGTAAGIVAAVLIYIFRGPLWDVLTDMFSRGEATDPASSEFEDGNGPASLPAVTE